MLDIFTSKLGALTLVFRTKRQRNERLISMRGEYRDDGILVGVSFQCVTRFDSSKPFNSSLLTPLAFEQFLVSELVAYVLEQGGKDADDLRAAIACYEQ